MNDNVIYKLGKTFALRIIKLYTYLCDEKKEYVISKQIYRCGTSIGANIAESIYAQSEADYINKLKISLKEASETRYWIELLYESSIIDELQYQSLLNDLSTIIGTTINIINKINRK
jgi:four helix bundle protein